MNVQFEIKPHHHFDGNAHKMSLSADVLIWVNEKKKWLLLAVEEFYQ